MIRSAMVLILGGLFAGLIFCGVLSSVGCKTTSYDAAKGCTHHRPICLLPGTSPRCILDSNGCEQCTCVNTQSDRPNQMFKN